ncbi:hypothetical protein AMATHDRAFT_68849 [Amanita thiersii Skay4041]|uniref:Uncharacterized protein n=1 Tax=Amanita thiersii Skay4041 TaxID=703135 RepID=A0A2A9NGX8_9AGAR|nr:hypothetical protein AMATHDRAFT_68849 [Amanita thiersii Skay4041]
MNDRRRHHSVNSRHGESKYDNKGTHAGGYEEDNLASERERGMNSHSHRSERREKYQGNDYRHHSRRGEPSKVDVADWNGEHSGRINERTYKGFGGYMRAWGDEEDEYDKRHDRSQRQMKHNNGYDYRKAGYSTDKYFLERRKEIHGAHGQRDYYKNNRMTYDNWTTKDSRRDDKRKDTFDDNSADRHVNEITGSLRPQKHDRRIEYEEAPYSTNNRLPSIPITNVKHENGNQPGGNERTSKATQELLLQWVKRHIHEPNNSDKEKTLEQEDNRSRKQVRSMTPPSERPERGRSMGVNGSESDNRSAAESNSRSRSPSRGEKRRRHSSHRSSKRKQQDRSRSRSSSDDSPSSPEERERRKRKKKDKKRKDKKRKDKEEKRSVLTGKKIKLKVKKDKADQERDVNREELLQFLNSTFE